MREPRHVIVLQPQLIDANHLPRIALTLLALPL
jgi:hypothetical protein